MSELQSLRENERVQSCACQYGKGNALARRRLQVLALLELDGSIAQPCFQVGAAVVKSLLFRDDRVEVVLGERQRPVQVEDPVASVPQQHRPAT